MTPSSLITRGERARERGCGVEPGVASARGGDIDAVAVSWEDTGAGMERGVDSSPRVVTGTAKEVRMRTISSSSLMRFISVLQRM
jgi:hypothetical protein